MLQPFFNAFAAIALTPALNIAMNYFRVSDILSRLPSYEDSYEQFTMQTLDADPSPLDNIDLDGQYILGSSMRPALRELDYLFGLLGLTVGELKQQLNIMHVSVAYTPYTPDQDLSSSLWKIMGIQSAAFRRDNPTGYTLYAKIDNEQQYSKYGGATLSCAISKDVIVTGREIQEARRIEHEMYNAESIFTLHHNNCYTTQIGFFTALFQLVSQRESDENKQACLDGLASYIRYACKHQTLGIYNNAKLISGMEAISEQITESRDVPPVMFSPERTDERTADGEAQHTPAAAPKLK